MALELESISKCIYFLFFIFAFEQFLRNFVLVEELSFSMTILLFDSV